HHDASLQLRRQPGEGRREVHVARRRAVAGRVQGIQRQAEQRARRVSAIGVEQQAFGDRQERVRVEVRDQRALRTVTELVDDGAERRDGSNLLVDGQRLLAEEHESVPGERSLQTSLRRRLDRTAEVYADDL